MYKKYKLFREVMYNDIKDIIILKKWQNNVIIICIHICIFIKFLQNILKNKNITKKINMEYYYYEK